MGPIEVVLADFERTLVRMFDSKVEQQFFDEVKRECITRDVPHSVRENAGTSPYSLWTKAYKWAARNGGLVQAEMLHHAVSKIAKQYELDAAETIKLFEGVHGILEQFKIAGIAVVVVSNNATAAVELVLEKNDARGLVDNIIGREYLHEMAGNLKPKPNLLLKALKCSERHADAALLVGDSIDDMRAGRAAGIQRRVALLDHSTATRLQLYMAGARRIVGNFGDLPNLRYLRRALQGADASAKR